MIVKIPLLLALCVCIKDVSSASFSKVFVQSGLDYPAEYAQYGAPYVSYSPQIAQLTAAPVGSVLPYSSNYVPCGTPCIYSGQVPSIAPGANIVQYRTSSLPVVVAPSRSEPSGYEYSYVVYDDQTGDHKAQRELSDGSVVRGGYSFLQPDGFVREVQYEADDLRGFNAVVKNYVPVSVETKHEHAEKEPAPCHDIKNEHLTHESPEEKHSESKEPLEEHSHESHHTEPAHDNLKAETLQEVHHEEHSEPHEGHELPHEEHHDAHEEHHEAHEEPHEVHIEIHEEHHEAHEEPHEAHVETHEEHHESHEEHLESHKEHSEGQAEESHEGHVEPQKNENHDEKPHEEHETHEEPAPHAENAESSVSSHESHESHIEPEARENHENHIAVAEHTIENSNILVPYNDIIRCVQAAINGANEVASPHKPESPLTYIILNKPC